MHERSQRGARAEALAAQWLERHGYRILARNVRYRVGEIDLIVQLGQLIVFVEVRSRQRHAVVGPEASVTLAKRRKMIRAAQRWLGEQGRGCEPTRFDLIAVTIDRHDYASLRHVPGAFVDDAID